MQARFKISVGQRGFARGVLFLVLGLGSACASSAARVPDGGSSGGSAGIGADSGAAQAGSGGSAGVSGAAGSAGTGVAGANADMDAASTPPDTGTDSDAGAATDAGATLAGWTLTFSDEFNGKSGDTIDSSKWNLIDKGDGFGNNELQFYTSRSKNIALDGHGSLVITTLKESYMGRDYTSAKLETSGKFEQTYGRFEARMQLPHGQGMWPAFWMLGNNIGSAGWPNCGEIDIMENIGKEPSIVHGSLHGPGYSGGNPLSGSYTLPNPQKLADTFHVFAVEWELDTVRFYIDEHLYETRTAKDVPGGSHWVYEHPFYLILNVAVGGQWPGNPDQSTVLPQTMSVDYVRVYKRSAH